MSNKNNPEQSKIYGEVRQAQITGVPVTLIQTPDSQATQDALFESYKQDGYKYPVLSWDIVRGLRPLNTKGEDACKSLQLSPANTQNPTQCLSLITGLPDMSLVFFHNPHRLWQMPNVGANALSIIQGILNCRVFENGNRMLVLLCPQNDVPSELSQFVHVLDEALPNEMEIGEIIGEVTRAAGQASKEFKITDSEKEAAVGSLIGLPAFSVRQAFSTAINPFGVDLDLVRANQIATINNMRGLEVYRGGEKFGDIRGNQGVMDFFGKLLRSGKSKYRCVVWIDELDKTSVTQGGNESSGTSVDQRGKLLEYMEEAEDCTGALFFGVPGSGKSLLAKAIGNESNILTIRFDLGAMKGGIVGESERNIRAALKVIDTVSQGRPLFIATCNSVQGLSPEMRRRFKLGQFFFDLPTKAEREGIWQLYMKRYELEDQELPDDAGWTGAEIRNCADLAFKMEISLLESAEHIVPLVISAQAQIEQMRDEADGRMLAASYSGKYRKDGPIEGHNERSFRFK